MFKKRTLNRDAGNVSGNGVGDDNGNSIQKRLVNTGIDLRKDIEEMQSIISTKKDHAKHEEQDQQKQQYKTQSSIFKTKRINKFTSHILKNLPTKTLDQQSKQTPPLNTKQPQIHNPHTKPSQQPQKAPNQNHHNELFRPNLSNYGLLDKSHFSSGPTKNAQIIEAGKGKTHQQALMDYYIKKRMEQMTKPTNPTPNQSLSGLHKTQPQRQPQAWQQVLQIQKQYLTQEQKIKEYSMQEIQKKLQKLAQQTIKTEIEKRNSYLKDLLENQYQRMEYASKKQLKYMKQEKERIERELNSKYRDSGRRSFIQNIKNQTL